MNCPHCNTELRKGMKFCPSCRREIDTNIICPKCGREVKNGLKFCSNCGNQVSDKEEIEANSCEPTKIVGTWKFKLFGKKVYFTNSIVLCCILVEVLFFSYLFCFIYNQCLGVHSKACINYRVTEIYTNVLKHEANRLNIAIDSLDAIYLSKEYLKVIRDYQYKKGEDYDFAFNRWTRTLNKRVATDGVIMDVIHQPYSIDSSSINTYYHNVFDINNYNYNSFQDNSADVYIEFPNDEDKKKDYYLYLGLVYEDNNWKVDIIRFYNRVSSENDYCEKSRMQLDEELY